MSNSASSIWHYLEELRTILIRVFVVFVVLFALLCWKYNFLFNLVAAPLLQHMKKTPIIMTNLVSSVVLPLTLAFYGALFLCFPYFLYEVWKYVSTALYPKERSVFLVGMIATVVLFFCGIILCHCVVLPMMVRFFITVAPVSVSLMPDAGEYLKLCFRMYMIFGVLFELPIVMFLLSFLGIIPVQFWTANRKMVVLVCLVVGMLLTPPDVVSQVLVALPMYSLYEIGIVLIKLQKKPIMANAKQLTGTDKNNG